MPTTVTVRDESTGGDTLHEFALEVLTERITVRELIRSRVYQEVQDYNLRQPNEFRGLVQPANRSSRKPRTIDWKKQYDKAVLAFEANQILVLVDDHQAAALDEVIEVRPGTCVTFLRLTLLVGG
jgi:hypothetical protein